MNLKYWALFFVAFTCACVSAEIHAIVIGELSYSIISNEDKTVDVALVDKTASEPIIHDLVIPSSVEIAGETYQVTAIHKRGFRHASRVYNSIEVPASVKDIGSEAFSGIKNIDEIKLHEGLETIGERAFYQSSISNPIDVPSSVKTIGDEAFYGMRNIKEIILHEGLESIGRAAFMRASITKVRIPSTCRILSRNLFSFSDLEECELAAPDSDIPAFCFESTKIKSFDFRNIKGIEGYAFSYCNFSDTIVIPYGCSIDGNAFLGSFTPGLKFEKRPEDLSASDSTKTILLSEAFYDLYKFDRLELPGGLKIYEEAFKGCHYVKTIIIQEGVEFGVEYDGQWSGVQVFTDWWDLEQDGTRYYSTNWIPDSIVYLASNPQPAQDLFQDVMYERSTLYVKPEALEKVKNTFPWNQFKKIEALSTGVEDIHAEPAEGKEDKEFIYTLEGVLCGSDRRALSPGIYIVRRNGKTSKIII